MTTSTLLSSLTSTQITLLAYKSKKARKSGDWKNYSPIAKSQGFAAMKHVGLTD